MLTNAYTHSNSHKISYEKTIQEYANHPLHNVVFLHGSITTSIYKKIIIINRKRVTTISNY